MARATAAERRHEGPAEAAPRAAAPEVEELKKQLALARAEAVSEAMEVQRLQKERADAEADLLGNIAVLKEEVKELTAQREKAFKDTAAAVRDAAGAKDEIRKGTEGVGQLQAQLAAALAAQREAEERAQQVAA